VTRWNSAATANNVSECGVRLTKTHPDAIRPDLVSSLNKLSASLADWPAGVGGKGNEGVAGLVTQTPGSIGYVELIYALQNKIAFGSVQNTAGEFVKASDDAVTKAADAAAATIPPDFRVSITNAPGAGAYPISSFTWILLYENPTDKASGKAIVDFMQWALTDGQKYCADLGYAPLPANVVMLEQAALGKIKVS